jgi:hypothetical protein
VGKGHVVRVELDVSRLEREERVVLALPDGLAGVKGGAALADNDLARKDVLV